MNPWETTALALGGVSAVAQTAIAVGYALAGGLALIPEFVAGVSGFGGSPEVTVKPVSGLRFSKAAEAAVSTLGAIASAADKIGALTATVGGYQRRQDDWTFQAEQAANEIAALDKQIAAAQIRVAIAEKELENHELQIDQAQAVDDYMRTKYTNQQLIDWQLRQLATIYFQSYQLAYDMAKRAQACLRLEIGDQGATFVQFGYWDGLKKGLLAGERLGNDLHRMEAAYLDQNQRDFEITKSVSLAQVAPLRLLELKEAGTCTVTLPEWLFNMDYPSHYRRRLKSVSVSIPCVVGPYTGVNCTLSLIRGVVRVKDDVAAADAASYGDPLGPGVDTRFFQPQVPITAVATSHGQTDSGTFELNFNDERFLPFEGAGAVSEWKIELPRENNQFDLATISDVILHVRYTARRSLSLNLAAAATAHLGTVLPSAGVRLLVLNQELSTAWYRFLHQDPGTEQTLAFKLGREHLPFYARSKNNINLTKVDLVVESRVVGNFAVKLTVPTAAASDGTLSPTAAMGNRHQMSKAGFPAVSPVLGDWKIQIRKDADAAFSSLTPDDIQNAYLMLGFTAT
jgi:hypothetical protein